MYQSNETSIARREDKDESGNVEDSSRRRPYQHRGKPRGW
ncbi:hypothetical protein CGRA01v4_04998 [Colletotrichum graminicola]|nr:hypothetical protein CGRA01v4_04998 [Colletotrichum graminicola]